MDDLWEDLEFKVNMFEIEKKFKVPEGFKRILLEKGWQYVKEIRFTDIYYDSISYELTKRDHWLRQRDKKWQLKCPASEENSQDSVRIDRYMEIENEKDIMDCLASILKVDCNALHEKKFDDVLIIFWA